MLISDPLHKLSGKNYSQELVDFQNALDQVAIVAITDPTGRIVYANDTFVRISGYSVEELVGQNHRILNSGYHSREFFKNMWDTIIAGKTWKGELRNRRKDGTFYWVETTIVPFLGEDGKPDRYLSVRYEITEKKRFEESLQSARRMWEKLYTELMSELDLAQKTQKLIMIPPYEEFAGFELHSLFRPCMNVSGDLITTRKNADGTLDILFADVAGHGISAALISSSLVFTFRNQSLNFRENPKTMLEGLSEVVNQQLDDLFISGVALRLNPESGTIQYCYAGHMPFLREREGTWEIMDGQGTPLHPGIPKALQLYEKDLREGDRFFLFSDGLYEVTNSKGEIMGYDSLIEGMGKVRRGVTAQKLVKLVMRSTLRFSDNSPQDDISLLIVDYKR